MDFHFNLFNHGDVGKRTLHDPMNIIAEQLRALGHVAGWNDKGLSTRKWINVVFEGFTAAPDEQDEMYARMRAGVPASELVPHVQAIVELRRAREQGARTVLIATEEPTAQGFNHGIDPTMAFRQYMFPEATKYIDAIWCLVPGTEAWYGQFGVPAAYLDLGWSPGMMRLSPIAPETPYGFFGSESPRRLAIIKRLSIVAGANILRVRHFPDGDFRDRCMWSVKTVLQIRAHDKMGLISSSRCCTALFLGRSVLAEPHELSGPWPKIVRMPSTMAGFYLAAKTAHRYWREMYEEQIARFKELLPPEACAGKVLQQTGFAPSVMAA